MFEVLAWFWNVWVLAKLWNVSDWLELFSQTSSQKYSAMNLPGQGLTVGQYDISYEPHQGMSFPQYLKTLRNIDDFAEAKLCELFAVKQLSGSMRAQRVKWKLRRMLARAVCRAVYTAVEDMPKGRLLSLWVLGSGAMPPQDPKTQVDIERTVIHDGFNCETSNF